MFIRLLGSRVLQIPADKFDSALCRLSVAIPCRQVTILSLSESGTLAYQKWHFRGAKVPLFVSQMRSNVC